MSFYVDIAEALDVEGIESRVNDGTLFVPVSADLEVQFVDITGGTGIPGANVFLAMANVAEDDEDFEAVLVGVVFSAEDAVATVSRHVTTDLVVGAVRELMEGNDPRIVDLEFIQDSVDALTVSAEVGESSVIVVTFDGEEETPSAQVQFITRGDDFDDFMDQAVAEIWEEEPEIDTEGPLSQVSEVGRQRILEGLVRDISDMTEEVLELGTFTDFDRLFDVLLVAQEQAASWEELLVPLEEIWEDTNDVDDYSVEDEDPEDPEDAESFDEGDVEPIG